jgi:hypothetical protein
MSNESGKRVYEAIVELAIAIAKENVRGSLLVGLPPAGYATLQAYVADKAVHDAGTALNGARDEIVLVLPVGRVIVGKVSMEW